MQRSFLTRWVRAGALVAFVDFCWALVLTATYGRPPMSVWNGVASVAFGPDMLTNGWHGIGIGLAMHVTTAFGWSLVFLLAAANFAPLRQWLSTRGGEVVVGLVYGPFIWVMMSSVVVPTMTGNMLHLTGRWFIQLAGHVVFVGMPIVIGARRGAGVPS
jgi:hypothetical protein